MALRGVANGARAVVSALIDAKVTRVFGIPGTHTTAFYNSLRREGKGALEHVTVRHEQGAGFAAEGYARATGDLGVACAITGVGVTNLFTPMASALADSIPMLVLSSEAPRFWTGRHGNGGDVAAKRQFSHYVPGVRAKKAGMFCKHTFNVGPEDNLYEVVKDAVELAYSGRPGPVHVNIPIDILHDDYADPVEVERSAASPRCRPAPEGTWSTARISSTTRELFRVGAPTEALHQQRCQRPVIVAGGGARDHAASMTRLAEFLSAPVITTVAGKGVVPDSHPLAVGCALHLPTVQAMLRQADCVLCLGTQLSPTDFWQFNRQGEEVVVFKPELMEHLKALVHVNVDPETLDALGQAGHALPEQVRQVSIQGDVGYVCEVMWQEIQVQLSLHASRQNKLDLSPSSQSLEFAWGGRAKELVQEVRAKAHAPQAMTRALMFDFESGNGAAMVQLLGRLSDAINKAESPPHVYADVCRLGYTALASFQTNAARAFHYPVGSTTLGFALPAAVGAAVAQAERGAATPTVCLVGDGGLQFTLAELAVAKEHKLPLVLVVWNDASYGEIRRTLGREEGFSTKILGPDLKMLAASYGLQFEHHDFSQSGEVDFERVFRAAKDGGPILVEVTAPWDAYQARSDGADEGEAVFSSLADEAGASQSLRGASARSAPGLVLGTMTFGWEKSGSPIGVEEATGICRAFLGHPGCAEIDTARIYAGGETERLLAQALRNLQEEGLPAPPVATKVCPAGVSGEADEAGHFQSPALLNQALDSFQALGMADEPLDVFYLHWPDKETCVQEALVQVQRLYEQGKFARFGLSNFTAGEVREIHAYMKRNGFVLPTVYQGLYNAVARGVEIDLLPVLRELGISFYAFNPLAGGLLAGKCSFRDGGVEEFGRFVGNEFYKDRYFKKEYFDALRGVEDEARAAGLPLAECALRWLAQHSQLDGNYGDKVIVGCSSAEQLTRNISSLRARPLPQAVLEAWGRAWDSAYAHGAYPAYAGYGESKKTEHPQELLNGLKIRGIQEAEVLGGGSELAVSFKHNPEVVYRFQAQWLLDSVPQATFNESTVRRDASQVFEVHSAGAKLEAVDVADPMNVSVTFAWDGRSAETCRVSSDWLQAFAPFVAEQVVGPTEGRPPLLHAQPLRETPRMSMDGQGFLVDALMSSRRVKWHADFQASRYDYRELRGKGLHSNKDLYIEIIERLMTEGIVMIDNLPPPRDLSQERVGEPLEDLANMVVGRMYQHPRRKTNCGVMRKTMATAEAAAHLTDYSMDKKLSMHQDHAFIGGGDVGALIQWMAQVQGSVVTQVCNSYAVADRLRLEDPEAFELLSTVPVTHSLRTFHYGPDGSYAHIRDPHHDGIFEDCATHPIIELGPDGAIRKITHQEIKRGVCAIPYDRFGKFLKAYTKWSRMCESPEFCAKVHWPENSVIAVNNHFVMHGRGLPYIRGENERVMVWGYSQKHITDLRYRLLKQWVAEERYGVPQSSLTNLPNQVLHQMMANLGETPVLAQL